MKDHFPCAECGRLTHIDDLDAKPEPVTGGILFSLYRVIWIWWTRHPRAAFDNDHGHTDWTRFECGECYGPGYVSNRAAIAKAEGGANV